MLDATAEALSTHLLTLLPAGRPHPRGDLDVLPRTVAHYLGSVLDRRVDQKVAAPQSPWLDANHELVQTAGKVWKTAAREAAQFPAGAWTKAVRTASRQVLGYLVEPVETIVSFAYTDASVVLELDALQERMAAFSSYPYFREVAEGYVQRKALDGIGRSDLEKLLRRIDRRMVAGFGASDWMTLLEPLFELISAIPNYETGVPSGLLKQFFKAKDLNEVASGVDSSKAYDREGLRGVLTRVAESAHPAEEEAMEEAGKDSRSEPADGEESAPEIMEDDGAEPLWQRLARGKEAKAPLTAPLPDATGNDVDEANIIEETDVEVTEDEEPEPVEDDEGGVEETAGEEPLWQRLADSKKQKGTKARDTSSDNRNRAKREPEVYPESLRNLETRVLGPSATERRDWYARQLTGGSEAAYRAILLDLDRAGNWDEAWPILKEAYQANKVEIYSDAIVAFTDAVEERFSE